MPRGGAEWNVLLLLLLHMCWSPSKWGQKRGEKEKQQEEEREGEEKKR